MGRLYFFVRKATLGKPLATSDGMEKMGEKSRMNMKNNDTWIVETIVPEEVYTDREEFLEYFYSAAINAGARKSMSTVLLGQRRMGKYSNGW